MLSFCPLKTLVFRSKKWSVLLLVPLLSGEASFAQNKSDSASGLGVFGNVLGIHGKVTLRVRGDVVLNRATVVGKGILSLRSDRQQYIVSTHSQVQNLHVANPQGVTLKGDLVIKKTLTVESGVLDAGLARLRVEKEALVLVRNGGQVKRSLSVAMAEQDRATRSATADQLWAIITGKDDQLGLNNLNFVNNQLEYSQLVWQTDLPQTPSPPPEA